MKNVTVTDRCRLCGSCAEHAFTARVRGKYDVAYSVCTTCRSCQSEKPYWLKECYATDITGSDTNYLSRNLRSYAHTIFLYRLLALPKGAPIIDFGGGLGVLARLLSERGLLAYSADAYSRSPFQVDAPARLKPAMVTAVEVFEHLPEPAADLAAIFNSGAECIYVSTEIYRGQGSDWWYFSFENGEHVFFYSPAAMRLIAHRFGYSVTEINGRATLFTKTALPGWKALVCKIALSGPLSRPLRTWAFWGHETV